MLIFTYLFIYLFTYAFILQSDNSSWSEEFGGPTAQ